MKTATTISPNLSLKNDNLNVCCIERWHARVLLVIAEQRMF
jgi:hypothetical protein